VSSDPGRVVQITLHVNLVRPEDKREATSQTASAGTTPRDVEGQGVDIIADPVSL